MTTERIASAESSDGVTAAPADTPSTEPAAEPFTPPLQSRWLRHRVMREIDHVTDAAEAGADWVTGLRTGFYDYDCMTCGLQPGQLTLVSGAGGSGKTAFVLNIVEQVRTLDGKRPPVVVFSFRTSAEAVTQRLIASLGRIDSHHLRIGALRDDEWKRLTSAVDELEKWDVLIDDDMGHTVDSMRKAAMKVAVDRGPLGLVVVDGLGWIEGTEKLDSVDRWARMDQIARGLKTLARDLNCHVMMTSDLKKHAIGWPSLSDLYGPSTLPSIADVVTLIYREEQFNPDTKEPGVACISIAKQEGPVGMLKLTFMRPLMKFDNLAPGTDY